MAMWHVWLIVALVFFILEIFTTGIAVICFSFGAIGSCIAALLGANLTWQVIVFAIVTLLSFIFIRPMLIKLFYKKGVTDPDYCVLKFTATKGRYYCDLKTESFDI